MTSDLRSRGRALALFFGIAGGLTAIGPIAGGSQAGVQQETDGAGQFAGEDPDADLYPAPR